MHVVFHVLEQMNLSLSFWINICLAQSGFSLDFSDLCKCSDIVYHRNYNVKSRTSESVSPESEAVVYGSNSSQNVYPGVQAMCTQHHIFQSLMWFHVNVLV